MMLGDVNTVQVANAATSALTPLCPTGYQTLGFGDGLNTFKAMMTENPAFIVFYLASAPLQLFSRLANPPTGGRIIDGPNGQKCAQAEGIGYQLGLATPALIVIGSAAYWLFSRGRK